MKEKTVSLVEQTANRIVEYFEKNDLKVGDKLPNEYTLAQDLEVGRSTLREYLGSTSRFWNLYYEFNGDCNRSIRFW